MSQNWLLCSDHMILTIALRGSMTTSANDRVDQATSIFQLAEMSHDSAMAKVAVSVAGRAIARGSVSSCSRASTFLKRNSTRIRTSRGALSRSRNVMARPVMTPQRSLVVLSCPYTLRRKVDVATVIELGEIRGLDKEVL